MSDNELSIKITFEDLTKLETRDQMNKRVKIFLGERGNVGYSGDVNV
jgi:hypothetical protein